MNNSDEEMKEEVAKKFNSIEDNTSVNDEENKLKFAKLNVPASVIDYLMDHYGFFDLVETNMLALYILNTFGHIEDDGFKLAIYKKTDTGHESYSLDINELIARFRIGLAETLNKNKSVETKEQNESDKV